MCKRLSCLGGGSEVCSLPLRLLHEHLLSACGPLCITTSTVASRTYRCYWIFSRPSLSGQQSHPGSRLFTAVLLPSYLFIVALQV